MLDINKSWVSSVYVFVFKRHSHPSTLLLGAVSMAVQTGKDRSWGHEFTCLVPAVSVTNACGIILTLPVEDWVQPVSEKEKRKHKKFWFSRGLHSRIKNVMCALRDWAILIKSDSIKPHDTVHSLPVSGDEVLQL